MIITSTDAEGINHEISYPYQAKVKKNSCKTPTYWNSGAKIVDKVVIKSGDRSDKKLMQLVMNYGAVVIALAAGEPGFMNYASGVYDTCRYVCMQIQYYMKNTYQNSNILVGG